MSNWDRKSVLNSSSKPEKKLQFSDESRQTGPTAKLTQSVLWYSS